MCSSIGIYKRTPELAGLPLASSSLHRWEQVHTEHITGVKESGDNVVNVTLPVTSSSMTARNVSQSVSDSPGNKSKSYLTVPWLLLGTRMKSSERLSDLMLVLWALGSSWWRTMFSLMYMNLHSSTATDCPGAHWWPAPDIGRGPPGYHLPNRQEHAAGYVGRSAWRHARPTNTNPLTVMPFCSQQIIQYIRKYFQLEYFVHQDLSENVCNWAAQQAASSYSKPNQDLHINLSGFWLLVLEDTHKWHWATDVGVRSEDVSMCYR